MAMAPLPLMVLLADNVNVLLLLQLSPAVIEMVPV